MILCQVLFTGVTQPHSKYLFLCFLLDVNTLTKIEPYLDSF